MYNMYVCIIMYIYMYKIICIQNGAAGKKIVFSKFLNINII